MPRVYRGSHVGRPGVRHLSATRATVRCDEGMLIEMDGEQIGQTPIEVVVVPRALRVFGLPETLQLFGGCTDPSQ